MREYAAYQSENICYLPLPEAAFRFEDQVWPLVRLDSEDSGAEIRMFLAHPMKFQLDCSALPGQAEAEENPTAYREQVCRRSHALGDSTDGLKVAVELAWGLSVHRAQGQEFAALVVHCARIHTQPGMMFTALSRATSPDGLLLIGAERFPRQHLGNVSKVSHVLSYSHRYWSNS